VFIGFTSNSDVIHSAMPIPLTSAGRLHAYIALEMRQKFDFRLADFLGITLVSDFMHTVTR
jgi:hypothetical protein